jgi:hypothetical protein
LTEDRLGTSLGKLKLRLSLLYYHLLAESLLRLISQLNAQVSPFNHFLLKISAQLLESSITLGERNPQFLSCRYR